MRPRTNFPSIKLVEEATQTFLDWAAAFLYPVDDPFPRAKILATRLGAHYRADGLTEIAFWVPEVKPETGKSWLLSKTNYYDQIKQAQSVYFAVFTPLQPIDFRASEQVISQYCSFRLKSHMVSQI